LKETYIQLDSALSEVESLTAKVKQLQKKIEVQDVKIETAKAVKNADQKTILTLEKRVDNLL
jgi:outer membrane murein-binding lipoprotein Lpp